MADSKPKEITLSWQLNCSDLYEEFIRYDFLCDGKRVGSESEFEEKSYTFTKQGSGESLSPGTVYKLSVELVTNGSQGRKSSSIYACTGWYLV